MGSKFKWKQIPQDEKGFVDYYQIKSPVVRRIVSEAERKKLTEEYKARLKWSATADNEHRMKNIEKHLNKIEYLCSEP